MPASFAKKPPVLSAVVGSANYDGGRNGRVRKESGIGTGPVGFPSLHFAGVDISRR